MFNQKIDIDLDSCIATLEAGCLLDYNKLTILKYLRLSSRA